MNTIANGKKDGLTGSMSWRVKTLVDMADRGTDQWEGCGSPQCFPENGILLKWKVNEVEPLTRQRDQAAAAIFTAPLVDGGVFCFHPLLIRKGRYWCGTRRERLDNEGDVRRWDPVLTSQE